MKKIFLLKYLLLYTTLASKHQRPLTAKEISPPSSSPEFPIFTWTSATSLHVTYSDHQDDTIQLVPSETGDVPVKCLYTGTFSQEATASAVVSGCRYSESIYITVYSKHLQGTVFTVKDNVTTEEVNSYANGGIDDFEEYPLGDSDEARVKRPDFYYYSGEEEYVGLDYDGPVEPTPQNLLLRYKLGFDETLKAHFGGDEDLARAYTISVATHASLHMKHSSLGVKIHMKRVGQPIFGRGKSLSLSTPLNTRKSLQEVESMKEMEPIPLIMFCKSDDLSTTVMGVSWPGWKGGACNPEKGASVVKWRSNVALAGVTLAHESGHLTGQLHDSQEDGRNEAKGLFDPQNPCEGRGIMSSGNNADRPEEWSKCSAERLKRWFPKHGQCLRAPQCTDGLDFSTPCSCGSSMCLAEHIYCWKTGSNEAEHQCLSRMDLGIQLQKIQTCECTVGEMYDGDCYLLVTTPATWLNAQQDCTSRNGRLASIYNSGTNNFIANLAGGGNSNTWIGASDSEIEGVWKWTNGDISTYTSWYKGEPNNAGGVQDCAAINFKETGKWYDRKCEDQHQYVCQGRKMITEGCSVGEMYKGKCYLLISTPATWMDAKLDCTRRNGKLASIDNAGANNFIARLAGGGNSRTWIGASDSEREGVWKWTISTYTSWYKGEPNNAGGVQDCAVINFKETGKWDDGKCEDRFPYVCEWNELNNII